MTPQQIERELCLILERVLHLAIEDYCTIIKTCRLDEDLRADFVDRVEIAMEVEQAFTIIITDEEIKKVQTFGEFLDLVTSKIL